MTTWLHPDDTARGQIQYLGFEENGEEVERFLGDAFESHVPSKNQIIMRIGCYEVTANPGDWIARDSQGRLSVGAGRR